MDSQIPLPCEYGFASSKFEEEVQVLRQSRAISEELKDKRSLAMVLNSLGGIYLRQGEVEEAVEVFKRSFVLSEAETRRAMILTFEGEYCWILSDQRRLLRNSRQALKLRND
jgi:hypothetical protein